VDDYVTTNYTLTKSQSHKIARTYSSSSVWVLTCRVTVLIRLGRISSTGGRSSIRARSLTFVARLHFKTYYCGTRVFKSTQGWNSRRGCLVSQVQVAATGTVRGPPSVRSPPLIVGGDQPTLAYGTGYVRVGQMIHDTPIWGHPDIVVTSIPEDFRRAIQDTADIRRGL
jgi:hypothetical protein